MSHESLGTSNHSRSGRASEDSLGAHADANSAAKSKSNSRIAVRSARRTKLRTCMRVRVYVWTRARACMCVRTMKLHGRARGRRKIQRTRPKYQSHVFPRISRRRTNIVASLLVSLIDAEPRGLRAADWRPMTDDRRRTAHGCMTYD